MIVDARPIPFSPTDRDTPPTLAATVILPAYNEAAALPIVLAGLIAALGDSGDSEIIVVDDGSTDDTALVVRDHPCRLLRHARNQGKGAAVRTGLRAAHGRFIVVMDADCTYPAAAVPAMLALAREYDFVRCTRCEGAANIPPLNRLGNRLLNGALRTLHGVEGDDHLSGLYGLRRGALDAMALTAERFDLEVEIAVKAHALRLRVVLLPIQYGARLGPKKLRAWRDGWSILCRAMSLALYERFA